MKRRFATAVRLTVAAVFLLTLAAGATSSSAKYISGTLYNYESAILTGEDNKYNWVSQQYNLHDWRGFDIIYTAPILVTPDTNPGPGQTNGSGTSAQITLNGCPSGWYAFKMRGGRGATGGGGGAGGGGATLSGVFFWNGGTMLIQAGKGGDWGTNPTNGVEFGSGPSRSNSWSGGGGGYSAIFNGNTPGQVHAIAVAGGGGGGADRSTNSGITNNRGGNGGAGGGNLSGVTSSNGVGGNCSGSSPTAGSNPGGAGNNGSGGGGGGGGGAGGTGASSDTTDNSWRNGYGGAGGNQDGNPSASSYPSGGSWYGIGGGGGSGAHGPTVNSSAWDRDGGDGGSSTGGSGKNGGGSGSALQGGTAGSYAGGGGGGYAGGGGGGYNGTGPSGGGGGGSSYLVGGSYGNWALSSLPAGWDAVINPTIPSTTVNGIADYNGYVWICYLGARSPWDPNSVNLGVDGTYRGNNSSGGYSFNKWD